MISKRWVGLIVFITLIAGLLQASPVIGQTTSIAMNSSITYQNIGTETAHITLLVYPEGETNPITITRPDLPKGASATVNVGSLTSSTGFHGSAVVKSDVPLAILSTQIPSTSTLKIRPMTAGFSTGSPDIWFLYVNKSTTSLAVQNLMKVPSNFKFTFFGTGSPVIVNKTNIPAGGSIFLPVTSLTEVPDGFSGVVHVEATTIGIPLNGRIVGNHLNVNADGSLGHATEGVTQLGSKIYMPLALCNTTGAMNSHIYVFNPDASKSTNVTVTYSSGKTETKTLAPLSRQLFIACDAANATGFNGSAIFTSNVTDIMAFGYIKGNVLAGSYTGQVVGSNRLAVPFANYSTNYYSNGQRHRTVISIMNLGASLASGAVKVTYYDRNGKLMGTHSLGAIASGKRVDSNATNASAGAEFGYYSDGSNGGSAIIQGPAGANLMAVAFVKTTIASGKFSGELYNAIPDLLLP